MPEIRITLSDFSQHLFFTGTNRTALESWRGSAREVIQLLIKFAQLTPTFNDGEQLRREHSISPKMNHWDLCVRLLVLNVTDLCPVQYSITKERQEVVEFLSPYLSEEKHAALIIKEDNDEVLEVGSVFNVYRAEVWWFILACLVSIPIIGAVCEIHHDRARFSNAWRNINDFVLGSLFLQGVDIDVAGRLCRSGGAQRDSRI